MPDLGQLPSAVRERAILTTLGPAPALVVLPESASAPPPVLLWLHGRQANKEIDPGRALRLFENEVLKHTSGPLNSKYSLLSNMYDSVI